MSNLSDLQQKLKNKWSHVNVLLEKKHREVLGQSPRRLLVAHPGALSHLRSPRYQRLRNTHRLHKRCHDRLQEANVEYFPTGRGLKDSATCYSAWPGKGNRPRIRRSRSIEDAKEKMADIDRLPWNQISRVPAICQNAPCSRLPTLIYIKYIKY